MGNEGWCEWVGANMGKKEVEKHLATIEGSRKEEVYIAAKDIDQEPTCAWCGAEMPYVEFNERSPTTDYIVHVLPGEDEHTPSGRVVYCSSGCFVSQRQEILSG